MRKKGAISTIVTVTIILLLLAVLFNAYYGPEALLPTGQSALQTALLANSKRRASRM